MVNHFLDMLNDPFLARRERAEEAWDNRLKEAEIDCPACNGSGWPHWSGQVKCGECLGGSIYTWLCIRCSKDDNHCECSVADFM